MTTKIGVIGMGHVGSTVAHAMIVEGVAQDYVLIDTNEAKVKADALDFEDAMANIDNFSNIIVNDYHALKDADVIVSALGNIDLQNNSNNDRFAEFPFTSAAAKDVAEQIKASGFNGVIVVISNPVDVITSIYQKYSNLPKNQVIGTGTLLDSARMKRAVGQHLNLNPKSVFGYNLGEHGNSQFTAWSQVRVKGTKITELVKDEELDLEQLSHESIIGGHTVFRGKLYTNYGVASATVALVKAILTDAKVELPVSNYYEPLKTYLSYPAVVGRKGIIEQVKLKLTDDEEDKLAMSANYIKEKFDSFQNQQ